MSVRPNAVIRQLNGRPTIFVDGEPQALPGFNPTSNREPFDKSVSFFANHKMGVYIIQALMQNFWRGDQVFDHPTPADGDVLYDVDEQAATILHHDPAAYIMVRFTPNPPVSWRQIHANELVITEGHTTGSPSFASDLFWGYDGRRIICHRAVL